MSKGNVDSAEAAKNMVYLTKLANVSKDPNSEGARGELLGYLNTLSTAQSILAPYAGQPILVNGKSASVDGSLLTYFRATQVQRDDPYANESWGGIPDPVFPNVAGRDLARLENFAAQNGSATPVYPVEQLLLGAAVTDRVVGTLGRYFESIEVGLAGTLGSSARGNISAQKVTMEGMSLSLSAEEQGLVSGLEGVASNEASGKLRESVANSYFIRNGFTPLEGKCGTNCFDGVYMKDGKIYINEVKPLNADNSIKLTPDSGTLPTQMSDDWILYAANRLKQTKDPVLQNTGRIILDAIESGNVIKVVTGVNSQGATAVKLR